MRKLFANWIFALRLRLFIRSHRPRFQRWTELEELKGYFLRAAEEGGEFPQALARLLSAALSISPSHLKWVDWRKQFLAFNYICLKNLPLISLPLLTEAPTIKSKRDAWDYTGRIWYLYAHMVAGAYGWTLEKISQLKVEDALAIIQEILTDEQLQREWEWGMSERAYSYDARSKVSKFNELPRPYWMKPKIGAIKKTKILKSMLPIGNVNYEAWEAAKPEDTVS